jgi:hypothetical protein
VYLVYTRSLQVTFIDLARFVYATLRSKLLTGIKTFTGIKTNAKDAAFAKVRHFLEWIYVWVWIDGAVIIRSTSDMYDSMSGVIYPLYHHKPVK